MKKSISKSLSRRASVRWSRLAGVLAWTFILSLTATTFAASYLAPVGGWLYRFEGADGSAPDPVGAAGSPYATANPVGATNNMDGTWDNRNGSDEWAGDGLSSGPAGGVEFFNIAEGSGQTSIVTIQDAVTTTSGTGNSRKIYFSHDLLQNGLADSSFLNNGVTLSFRARLTPSMVDGFGIFSGGKGHFGVHQATGDQLISFSLVRATEDGVTNPFPSAGLTMNSNVNDAPQGTLDSNTAPQGSSLRPLVPLDPSTFHEFWINIAANDATAGNGTHTVTVYYDDNPAGATVPAGIFNVTSGLGADASGGNDPSNLKLLNALFMGSNNSSTTTSFDVDFYAVTPGIVGPMVPEPSSFVLAACGLAGAGYYGWRRRRQ